MRAVLSAGGGRARWASGQEAVGGEVVAEIGGPELDEVARHFVDDDTIAARDAGGTQLAQHARRGAYDEALRPGGVEQAKDLAHDCARELGVEVVDVTAAVVVERGLQAARAVAAWAAVGEQLARVTARWIGQVGVLVELIAHGIGFGGALEGTAA